MYVTVQCWLMKSKRIGKLALLETICEANGTSNHNPIKFPLLQQSHAQVSISSKANENGFIMKIFWNSTTLLTLSQKFSFTQFCSCFYCVFVTLLICSLNDDDDENGSVKMWRKKGGNHTQHKYTLACTLRYGYGTHTPYNLHLSWFMQKHNIHIKSMSWLKIECDIFWFRLDWLHLMEFYSFQWLDLQNTTVLFPRTRSKSWYYSVHKWVGKIVAQMSHCFTLSFTHIVLYAGLIVRCSSRFKLF